MGRRCFPSRAQLLTLCAALPQLRLLPASAGPTQMLASSIQDMHHAEQPRGGRYILPALPSKSVLTHGMSTLAAACCSLQPVRHPGPKVCHCAVTQ